MDSIWNTHSIEIAARIMLALPFLHSGVNAICDFQNTVFLMKSRNLPLPSFGLFCAILLKLFGGICIILKFYDVIASIALIVFTLVCTVIFHDFWNQTGMQRKIEIFWVTTNIGLVGGLFALIALALN